jgi:uroporphyrinogen-III synthase
VLPLADRRVLVTRAPHQASELADRLRALGAHPILIPTIEIAPPTSFAALDAALAQLATFNLIVFTSANAVEAFHQRAQHLGLTLAPHQIAAVGPSTARALERIGLRADILPPTYTADSLAAILLPTARGQQILLVRPETPRAPSSAESGVGWKADPQADPLATALAAAGARITIAPAYTNRIPGSSLAAFTGLFAKPANYPDAITFTSASTARNLIALLEAATLDLPAPIIRASIGPITSRSLRELNLPPHVEATESTIFALAAALAAYFENSPPGR